MQASQPLASGAADAVSTGSSYGRGSLPPVTRATVTSDTVTHRPTSGVIITRFVARATGREPLHCHDHILPLWRGRNRPLCHNLRRPLGCWNIRRGRRGRLEPRMQRRARSLRAGHAEPLRSDCFYLLPCEARLRQRLRAARALQHRFRVQPGLPGA